MTTPVVNETTFIDFDFWDVDELGRPKDKWDSIHLQDKQGEHAAVLEAWSASISVLATNFQVQYTNNASKMINDILFSSNKNT